MKEIKILEGSEESYSYVFYVLQADGLKEGTDAVW